MKASNLVILLALLASCNFQQDNKEKTAPKQSGTGQAGSHDSSSTNCYRYAGTSDTITLKLVREAESVTGTLVYNLKEKDKNTGTIRGSMKNDVLIADYTFMSEGVQSVRQVAFKWEGNAFVEGHGEIVNQNEKVRFKNADALQFDPSIRLTGIACR